MREPERDKERLLHILEAINHAQEFSAGLTLEQFTNDSLHKHATAYNIQIIGEAVYKLSSEFKESHADTPWRMIEKMRHILVHDYFQVNMNIFWSVIYDDLPVLKEQVLSYLKEFE